ATHLLYAQRIIDWFPQAKFVWIQRDPRDTALALRRLFGGTLRKHASAWRMLFRVGQDFQQRYPQSFHAFKFEELLLEPERTLSSLCHFLGVSYATSMLDRDVRSASVLNKELDYKQRALEGLDASKVREFERLASRQELVEIESICAREMSVL